MQSPDHPIPTQYRAAQPPAPVAAEPVLTEPVEEHPAEHIHLPPPTIWPPVTAFGVAFAGFGLVTTLWFCFIGIAIMLYGLTGWVQELRHESH